MNRKYQPSLLWARVAEFAAQQWPEAELSAHDLALYIYRTDTTGAYYLYGPKMYWSDEPVTGQHFSNINQDDLDENSGVLGEVVLYCRHHRARGKSVVIGTTYDRAWERLTAGDGPGRPGISDEPTVTLAVRVPESWAARIPEEGRSDWLRAAVKAKIGITE